MIARPPLDVSTIRGEGANPMKSTMDSQIAVFQMPKEWPLLLHVKSIA